MKTKLIILAAAGSALLFSCTDRNQDEEIQNNSVEKIDLKKEKLNRGGVASKSGDTIVVVPPPKALNGTNVVLTPENPDPSEGGDPKGLPPRK